MPYFFAGLALIGLGVVMLVNPKFVYEVHETWKHNGDAGEPSNLYLWHTRIGGIVFILAGICGLIVPFLS